MPEANGDVAEIVKLEGQAAQTEKASSADRWHAAYLIARQLDQKTFRQLSAEIKAAGGKGSIGHLERMQKCWKLVGAMQYEAIKEDYGSYPNFTSIYQSDEVRGENDESKGGDRGHGSRDKDEITAHSLVDTAADAIGTLRQNRTFWKDLSGGDIQRLNATRDGIRALLRELAG